MRRVSASPLVAYMKNLVPKALEYMPSSVDFFM